MVSEDLVIRLDSARVQCLLEAHRLTRSTVRMLFSRRLVAPPQAERPLGSFSINNNAALRPRTFYKAQTCAARRECKHAFKHQEPNAGATTPMSLKEEALPWCTAGHVQEIPAGDIRLQTGAWWRCPALAVHQAGCSAAGASCSNVKCFCAKDMGSGYVGEACDEPQGRLAVGEMVRWRAK